MASLEEKETWAVVAAVIGFLSGAGLMSHADLIAVFTEDLYKFVAISDGSITIHGKEMVAILAAATSYLAVLAMIGAAATWIIYHTPDRRIRYAALAVIFLIVSFFGTAVYSMNRGYRPLQIEIEKLRTAERQPLIPHWDWQ